MSRAAIAVLIPCYNEATTIAGVVADFLTHLPDAHIVVGDNNSSDDTAAIAADAGAEVVVEHRQGKGEMIRRLFAEVDAHIFIMADGDGTYPAKYVVEMVQLLKAEQLDMVVGKRVQKESAAYRAGHVLGNQMLTRSAGLLFGQSFSDMLSGYRVMSRRFVKSFPALSRGFEVETELTVHALELRLPCAEVDIGYLARPEGSNSKLSTYKDGLKISRMIAKLAMLERPLLILGVFAVMLALLAIILAAPLLLTYLQTGLVPRFPTALLSTGLVILAFLLALAGVVLQSITIGRREMKRLAYLQFEKRN